MNRPPAPRDAGAVVATVSVVADGTKAAALCAGMTLISLTLFGVASYPLSPLPLIAALAAYAGVLWVRPAAFLLIVPAVLPVWDLGLWTGWMMVGESDLFIAATLAILLVRTPLRATDPRLAGAAGVVLLAFTACWFAATCAGMASPLGAPYSDNALLRPDNALRLSKSLGEALVLMPFLRRRQQVHGDAVTLLGWGLTAGLAGVALIVVAERLLFAGIFDFSTTYRVAGPFSSMHVGGGHIGACTALILPFSLCLSRLRPRWVGTGLMTLACLCGVYTLAVTFARTAYAAAIVAMLVSGSMWLWAVLRHRVRRFAFGIVPVVVVVSALAATASFTAMYERFAASGMDLSTRQENWRTGLAVRDGGIPETLLGMGLGTYQRAMLMRSPVNRPSDLWLSGDDRGAYVSMRIETPFYLGQKIMLPEAGAMHLTLQARSHDGPAAVAVLICDKILLYSDNCRGANTLLAAPNQWVPFKATLPSDGLGGPALAGLLRRPVEFSISGPAGHRIDVRDIILTDGAGRLMLANGDFGHGLDRWLFTDDSHVSWRMLSQYLMLFFETGIVGVAAFLALAGLAFAGGVRALRGGDVSGAAVAGAVAGFMISGLFDNLLEAPRVATLFFLICICGLLQWEARVPQPD